jgi:hypothetical protein
VSNRLNASFISSIASSSNPCLGFAPALAPPRRGGDKPAEPLNLDIPEALELDIKHRRSVLQTITIESDCNKIIGTTLFLK